MPAAADDGQLSDTTRAGWLGRDAHTQLFFEYTALLVLRPSIQREG